MKNITVSVDDDTHRLARICAAELDTSVSALVREYLRALAGRGSVQDEAGARGDAALRDAAASAARQHVQRLVGEAWARAETLAKRPIGDRQELTEFRRRLLGEIASDFEAAGVGIRIPGALDREEAYDRAGRDWRQGWPPPRNLRRGMT